MGAENAKIESAEKSAETGGHRFEWFGFDQNQRNRTVPVQSSGHLVQWPHERMAL
jgi:hypothetical protein